MRCLIKPLGFGVRRAETLQAMSGQIAGGDWHQAADLYGVGFYGLDSWMIFVEGCLNVRPDDGKLSAYVRWAKRHGRAEHATLAAAYGENLNKMKRRKR